MKRRLQRRQQQPERVPHHGLGQVERELVASGEGEVGAAAVEDAENGQSHVGADEEHRREDEKRQGNEPSSEAEDQVHTEDANSGALPVITKIGSVGHPIIADRSSILADFTAARSPATIRAYQIDLADFARVIGEASPAAAADRLLACTAGEANRLALHYRDELQRAGLAPATIARRLATLRSLVRLAARLGLVSWALDVPAPRLTPYRDTRGPGRAGFLRLVAAAEAQAEPKRSRDLAILWLLYGRGLRRAEVVRLRAPNDLDLAGERIRILGKHRTEPEWVTVPPATLRALGAWLAVRGDAPGPLFTRLDRSAPAAAKHGGPPGPLSGVAVLDLVADLGQRANIRVRPHGLRHAAVTEALAATHGDLRSVQRFARLKSANTIRIYDDERADLGGVVSRLIAP